MCCCVEHNVLYGPDYIFDLDIMNYLAQEKNDTSRQVKLTQMMLQQYHFVNTHVYYNLYTTHNIHHWLKCNSHLSFIIQTIRLL